MLWKELKALASWCSAKNMKTTRSDSTIDTIPCCFNESSYSVYPEEYKFVPVLSIPDMLETPMVNNDDNQHRNRMDDMKK